MTDFGATTPELIRMVEWLKARQVESVAMESTGVYWIAPHESHVSNRVGADVAVFASARKIATLIYRLLCWGQPYVDEGAKAYEDRYRQLRLKGLILRDRTSEIMY